VEDHVVDDVAEQDQRGEPHRGGAHGARDPDVRAEQSPAVIPPEATFDGATILSSYRRPV
jgi:hypothetical protein